VRVIRACQSLGLETVAIYSEADRGALPTRLADRAVCVGPPPSSASYLNAASILAAALGTGCDAVHPGYGFLSENPAFAAACLEQGLCFVGPPPEAIRLMGDKLEARRLAARLGVPVVAGSSGPVRSVEDAGAIGYPLLLKASAGGGGRGMRLVRSAAELGPTIERAAAEARAAFGDGTLYAERYLEQVRHVEVQVLVDARGGVVHLGERDCSLQRRHQKILEEAPSPALSPSLRRDVTDAALGLVRAVDYRGAGTVEFVFDPAAARFYFIEMNTRIQVEHPVTEMITGLDLVALQLRLAAGEPLPLGQADVALRGHAVECRINAEEPEKGFRPCPGTVSVWVPPGGDGVRVDTHIEPGAVVPPFYDSLLAKVVAHGADRAAALTRLREALARFHVEGVATTIGFHRRLIDHPDFVASRVHTRWVEEELARPPAPRAP
jgi:acetyl-CoA carboxylase biotin carboxylase subunit